MIQLGSILAIMWLYRARLVAVVRGVPSDQHARRLACALLVAVVPALVAGGLSAPRGRCSLVAGGSGGAAGTAALLRLPLDAFRILCSRLPSRSGVFRVADHA